VSDRSGIGPAELAVLEALDKLLAARPGAFARSSRALAGIDERIGLGPRYAYDLMLDLGRVWRVPVLLLAFHGNRGDQFSGDQFSGGAAGPGYTECRLSYAGQVTLAAERRLLAPVPVGLINGSMYRGGMQPPLEPLRVINALRRVLDDPQIPDAEMLGMVGPPDFLTGCTVTGDLGKLTAGRRASLRLTGQVTVADEEHLIIHTLPPHVGLNDIVRVIKTRAVSRPWAGSFPELDQAAMLPIADLEDEPTCDDLRLVITLRPGADPGRVRDSLLEMTGVAADVTAAFPAPLAELLRSWVSRHRGEDITASLAELDKAIRHDRQREQPRSGR
jgi:DNA gyrase/topoisomerase IV, subunit A